MQRMGRLGLALAAAGVAAACGQGSAMSTIDVLTAEPIEAPSTIAAVETPTPAATTPTATPTATPTEAGSRTPTDSDRGAFISAYTPSGARDLDVLAADLVSDGISEVLAVYVLDGAIRLDIAWWNGRSYDLATSLEGGAATDIVDLQLRDINADGIAEIVVSHRGDGGQAGVTVWQAVEDRRILPLIAQGGCHEGSSTYGAIGATLLDRNDDGAQEIYATCDDAPLARADWSTDRYVWADGAYRHLPEVTIAPVAPTTPAEAASEG